MNKVFSLITIAFALSACSGDDPAQPNYQKTENVLDFCTKLKNATGKDAYSYTTPERLTILSEGKKIMNPGEAANYMGQPFTTYSTLSFSDTDYSCVIALSNQAGDVASVAISKVSN